MEATCKSMCTEVTCKGLERMFIKTPFRVLEGLSFEVIKIVSIETMLGGVFMEGLSINVVGNVSMKIMLESLSIVGGVCVEGLSIKVVGNVSIETTCKILDLFVGGVSIQRTCEDLSIEVV